ncbi:MAG: DNA cytosine methyltransferase, partial [Candidatus Puniceispirillaceae bacterium]
MRTPESYSVIVVFCGCGGLSLGFKKVGFNILAGIDHDKPSIDSFNRNIGRGLQADLSSNDWPQTIKKQTSTHAVDVLIGGPPCQGYSLTGPRNFHDERNKLYNAMFLGA